MNNRKDKNRKPVFLCSVTEDNKQAEILKSRMNLHGLRVISCSGEQTTDYFDVSSNAIDESCVAVFIISKNARASHAFRRWLNLAFLKGVSVAALLTDDAEITPVMCLQLEAAILTFDIESDMETAAERLIGSEQFRTCIGEELRFPEERVFALVRKANGEKISLASGELRLGRRRSMCDYVIDNNKTVSRLHAVFRVKNGRCTVKDNKSLNGVFINGHKISGNTETELKTDDEIRLGSERFILIADNAQ